MADEPQKPKRRRRWLIVALVLAIVSSVSWWHWPRGDARFVGKWQVGSQVFSFYRNGSLRITDRANEKSLMTWHVEHSNLVLGPKVPDWLGQALSLLNIPLRSFTGVQFFHATSEMPYEIVECSDASIQIRGDRERVLTLTRIPE